MTLEEVNNYHSLSLPRHKQPNPASPPRNTSPGSGAVRPRASSSPDSSPSPGPSAFNPHFPPPRQPVALYQSATVDNTTNPLWDEDVTVDLGVTVTDFTTLSDFPTLRIEVRA